MLGRVDADVTSWGMRCEAGCAKSGWCKGGDDDGVGLGQNKVVILTRNLTGHLGWRFTSSMLGNFYFGISIVGGKECRVVMLVV